MRSLDRHAVGGRGEHGPPAVTSVRRLVLGIDRWYGVVAAAILSAGCSDSILAPERGPLLELPQDLGQVTFVTEGRPSSPYVLLEIRHEDGFRGFVAIDRVGRPVWYFRTIGSPAGATRRANGNFVFLDNERGLVEVTVDGDVVSELPQQARPGRFVHHDVYATPEDKVIFIAEDARPFPDTLVTGDAVWEWTPESGEAVMLWSTHDHFDPEVDRGERSLTTDWVHANSVSVGASGAIILSMHFLDQVVAIQPDHATLRWRLGGVGATVQVEDPFSGQHTAAELQPNRVLVFDNGFSREQERYSRAAEYVIEGNAARLDWEWRRDRDNWARVISSARRLPNGNTMVGFGLRQNAQLGSTGPIEAYEVTRQGVVVWHLTVDGLVSSMYRATPLFAF